MKTIDISPSWEAAAKIFVWASQNTGRSEHLDAIVDMGRGLDFIINQPRTDLGWVLLDNDKLEQLSDILNGGK